MSSTNTVIKRNVRAALTACVADTRVVTGTYKSFADRGDQALALGVYTVLIAGGPGSQDNLDFLDFTVVAQGWIPPVDLANEELGDPGDQIDELEGIFSDEVYSFVRGITGAYAVITDKRQSMQLESPYCWAAFDIRLGPFGLAPDQTGGDLQPFITYTQQTTLSDATGDTKPAIDIVTLPQP